MHHSFFSHKDILPNPFPFAWLCRIINWPIIALASQKNYISLYVCAVQGGEYIAEKYQNELGQVSVGHSCIRFKRIEDLNLPALKKIIRLAVKSPGLVGATKH